MRAFFEPLNRRRNYTVAPRTWVPGEMVTAGMMNSIRDNLLEVGTGVISIPGMQGGDMITAASPTQLSRVAPDWNKFPRYVSGVGWQMAFPTAGPHDLWIPASAMHPLLSVGTHVIVTYGYGSFTALAFPPDAWGQVSFTAMLPNCWNLAGYNVQFAWLNWSSSAGAIKWMLYCGCIPNWNPVNWGPAGAGVANYGVPGAPYYLQITPPVLMPYSNATAVNSVSNFLVQRAGPDPGDTFTSLAYLVGILISPVTTKDVDA